MTDELQSAFVLHARPWRETSLLIDVFTENYGKIALCAKGVRSIKSPKRSLLQPLYPLLISWKGRGELPILTVVEASTVAIKLTGNALYSAFYINELLFRLLHRHDPHPALFNHYGITLKLLSNSLILEQTLREFELFLLDETGYGLSLTHDSNDEPIDFDAYYLLNSDGAFQLVNKMSSNASRIFKGEHLISIAEKNWQDAQILNNGKRLIRLALQPLLGNRPLQSRKLFRRKL